MCGTLEASWESLDFRVRQVTDLSFKLNHKDDGYSE